MISKYDDDTVSIRLPDPKSEPTRGAGVPRLNQALRGPATIPIAPAQAAVNITALEYEMKVLKARFSHLGVLKGQIDERIKEIDVVLGREREKMGRAEPPALPDSPNRTRRPKA